LFLAFINKTFTFVTKTSMEKRFTGVLIATSGVLAVAGSLSSILALSEPLRTIILVISGVAIAIGTGFVYSKPKPIGFAERPKFRLEDEINDSKEVWFSWHTGSVKLAQGSLFENNHKYRFILTRPDSSAIAEIGKVANIGAEELRSDIQKFTTIIKAKNHPVKWFDGFLGSSIVIADPEENTGWMRIESFLPLIGAEFRPSVKIYKKNDEKTFLRIKKLYESLWLQAQEPK